MCVTIQRVVSFTRVAYLHHCIQLNRLCTPVITQQCLDFRRWILQETIVVPNFAANWTTGFTLDYDINVCTGLFDSVIVPCILLST
ncbi:hypothetical protein CEXT_358861 [Caerostris extrusa]|uniref:Uncharacterized protein n=1 Tax=Caerostris extrusa TaxID=172846 RepID=A0AAV4TIR5_CAEEX|nr:hypothetical protein CEXT_358861 [Caerostris extrusa]